MDTDKSANDPIRHLGSRIVYRNPWLTVREDTVLQRGSEAPYGVIERADSVAIVAVSRAREMLFLRQYRYPTREYSWELPMGAIDQDETPAAAAARELREETRLEPSSLRMIGCFRPVPALTPQLTTVFEASVETFPTAVDRPPDVDEIVDWTIVDLPRLSAMIAAHEITDGFTLAAMGIYFASPVTPATQA